MVFHRGLRVEVLDSVGEESFIFTEGLQFKFFWLRWGLEVWKLSSDGDFETLLCWGYVFQGFSSVEDLNDILQGISSGVS